MYCNKCGNQINDNEYYCNKCGNRIIPPTEAPLNTQLVDNNIVSLPVDTNNVVSSIEVVNNKKKINPLYIVIGFIGAILVTLIFVIVINISNKKIYISNSDSNSMTVSEDTSSNGNTSIISNHTYVVDSIENLDAAKNLITVDSVLQKNNCPDIIVGIEDEIIKNYNITAVNFCEMDPMYSKELGNVIKKIYEDFPSVRGYLTNMTILNVGGRNGYIAAFMPIFIFASTNKMDSYPWVNKTQLLLNSTYFLNMKKLESAVSDASNKGWFPPNSNSFAPIAHELGHYISFLAMAKHYNLEQFLIIDEDNISTFNKISKDFDTGDYSLSLIKEAYENYHKDTNDEVSLDEWRSTISIYAMSKDNHGEYIYDETIAEAFHDVYLNGENARVASRYIYKVLQSKLR